jgi:hypothetical protein
MFRVKKMSRYIHTYLISNAIFYYTCTLHYNLKIMTKKVN